MMTRLETIWVWFVASQIVCFVVSMLFVCYVIWREHHKGYDLTYNELGRTLLVFSMLSVMGLLLPVFAWAAIRTGKLTITFPKAYPQESVYDDPGHKRVFLHGSKSAKTLRALTADWENWR